MSETAVLMAREASRKARWAERMGAPPQGTTLARMAASLKSGRIEDAMAQRDEIQEQYSHALGRLLSALFVIGFCAGAFFLIWLGR